VLSENCQTPVYPSSEFCLSLKFSMHWTVYSRIVFFSVRNPVCGFIFMSGFVNASAITTWGGCDRKRLRKSKLTNKQTDVRCWISSNQRDDRKHHRNRRNWSWSFWKNSVSSLNDLSHDDRVLKAGWRTGFQGWWSK
jgi:hypothetical protein